MKRPALILLAIGAISGCTGAPPARLTAPKEIARDPRAHEAWQRTAAVVHDGRESRCGGVVCGAAPAVAHDGYYITTVAFEDGDAQVRLVTERGTFPARVVDLGRVRG